MGQGMEWTGLASGLVSRYPHEFSGRHCQCVGTTQALITKPALMISGEPVVSPDVPIRVMESIDSEYWFQGSRHSYTRALLNVIPVPGPELQKECDHLTIPGEPPSRRNFASGCQFANYCHISQPDCFRSTAPCTDRTRSFSGTSSCHPIPLGWFHKSR